jgi:polyphenol oxidase
LSELDTVLKNRKKILKDLGFSNLITLKQVHSDIIHIIDIKNKETFFIDPLIEGDGILTQLRDVLIGILTADCVPIYYSDKKRTFCGIAHAGWKGIKQKIHIKMLDKIQKTFALDSPIEILIGPHIRKCCYEIGKDLIDQLKTNCFDIRGEQYFLDMESQITQDFKESGIGIDQIEKYKACTKCNKFPSFYSYRGGDKNDRMLSFIGLCLI